MSNVSQDLLKHLRQKQDLPPGGGGGTSDGMETRVTKLEADMQDLKVRLVGIDAKMATKDDMSAMRADIAEMKGLMKAMPSTLQLLGFVVAIFVAAGLTRVFIPA